MDELSDKKIALIIDKLQRYIYKIDSKSKREFMNGLRKYIEERWYSDMIIEDIYCGYYKSLKGRSRSCNYYKFLKYLEISLKDY